MRVLLAIVSCHAFEARRKAIRETWLPLVPDSIDVKFFVGLKVNSLRTATPLIEENVVQLPVDDTYQGLAMKTKAIAAYAEANSYDWLCKIDDDVYLQPARLLDSCFEIMGDYIGRKRGPSGQRPAPYASGFCYWLSRDAMKIVAKMDTQGDPAEDRCVGNTLLEAGIECTPDYRFVVINSLRNAVSHTEGPRQGNSVISACEFSPEKMHVTHQEWLSKKSENFDGMPDGDFRDVCVLVKTFSRDGYMLRTVEGIKKTMPSAKIVLVDDGRESSFKISYYAKLRRMGHIANWLPFDSGFGAKANAGVKSCDRPYVLIASDDFNFDDKAADGVRKLITVMKSDSTVDVASGRVNGNPYEATLELKDDICIERAGYTEDKGDYCITDLTVNYSLIKRKVFSIIKWDDDVKIGGGEHGAFYIDLKRAGFRVAYVKGVSINEIKGSPDWSAANYAQYRGRARQPGRICLKRRGINKYHLMGGSIETT